MFDKFREKSSSKSETQPPNIPSQDPAPAYTLSSTLSSSIPFKTHFASLSLHMEDRLRFLRFPPETISLCRTAILSTWPKGIDKERPYANSQEIKLNGYPWRGYGKEAASASRLVTCLLATLHSNGWILTLNTDISQTETDKDSLLFRHQSPPPAAQEWCSIAFARTDRIRFIDCPDSLYASMPARLGPQVVKETSEYAPGVMEVKMHGFPWSATGEATVRAREVLLVLMEGLEEEGWSVYASVDQKDGIDTDTWHCCRPVGWTKGAPVYHH